MSNAMPSDALGVMPPCTSFDRAGDDLASFEVLYSRLRGICERHMLGERVGHTLQGTALAHEVFLRMRVLEPLADRRPRLSTRWFLTTAVATIRQVVVDHARTKKRRKRGGGWVRTAAEPDEISTCAESGRDAILLADELLSELALISPLQSQIAQLRFFGGLTYDQIALVVGIDESAVRREWNFARVWLGSRPAAEGWWP